MGLIPHLTQESPLTRCFRLYNLEAGNFFDRLNRTYLHKTFFTKILQLQTFLIYFNAVTGQHNLPLFHLSRKQLIKR